MVVLYISEKSIADVSNGSSLKMWILLVTLPMLISYGEAVPRKRVCVIGAGMAGVAAIKQVSDLIDDFEPIAFERNSDVGGLWVYTDRTEFDEHGLPVHSRVYKNMRTIFPKEVTMYPDYQHFVGRENRSFVSHQSVVEYIRNYTDHFDLRQYIQFDTLVKKVSPMRGNGDWTTWRVETRNLNTNEESDFFCDAVMVCNGHYFKPNVPKIPGIETFPGRVLHSSAYRTPDSFANQTVVVLGAGRSGIDISLDLSSYAKTVYLSHRHDKIQLKYPKNVIQVRGVVAANRSQLVLQDNSSVIADSFMYCTGYLYDFPFLDESSGISVEKKIVRPLYKHIVNIEHPSMGFIGLPSMVLNSIMHYMQSKYFMALLQGKVQLPSYVNMKNSVALLKSLKMDEAAEWNYTDDLGREAAIEKLPLFYKQASKLVEGISTHFADFSDFDLRIINDNEVLAIRRRDGKMGSRWEDFIDS